MALSASKEFWDDVKWEKEHARELARDYKGKWIAIVGKRVVSYGEDLKKVEDEARRLTGRQEVYTTYIEAGAAIY